MACRPWVSTGAAGLAVFFLFAAAGLAERRALLIGIDDYSGATVAEPAAEDRWPAGSEDASRRWEPLRGAVADAEAMQAMLTSAYKVPAANIVLLRDGEAMRARIRRAIESLIAASRAGDQVLFYFSGHGSQVTSAEAEEGDGRDETIVPADSRRGAADLRDKELRRLFNRLLDKGVDLTVILDSCHSGSGVRGDPGWTPPRAVAPVTVPRLEAIDAGPPLVDRGAVVLAAALDSGAARERCDADGCFGAFTRALLEVMSRASAADSVDDLFRRARARLRLYDQLQEPTLLAAPEVRHRPLFGGRRDRRDGLIQVAVEAVREDRRLLLQGGWVNGLTVGSELPLPGGTRVARIEALDGLDRAVAEVVVTVRSGEPPALEPGTLLSLTAWAPPPGDPLRLWIPPQEGHREAQELAAALARRAAAGAFGWVEDPAREVPTHVLDRRAGGWSLAAPEGEPHRFRGTPRPAEIAVLLAGSSRLYVRLPPPAALARRLAAVWGRSLPSPRLTEDASGADYVLASALGGDGLRYGWLHRSRFGAGAGGSDLPPRSEWVEWPAAADGAAVRLQAAAATLARVFGWLTLDSQEPEEPFPYRLAILERAALAGTADGEPPPSPRPARTAAGALLRSGRLVSSQTYQAALWSEEAIRRRAGQRYVYVFGVDSFGQSVLLFPREGNIENRFPALAEGEAQAPDVIALDRSLFTVVPPYGRDVYFLFTSSEMIHDVGVFEWTGARTRGRPTTALERLIAATTAGRRGTRTEAIPAEWSIERLVFETSER